MKYELAPKRLEATAKVTGRAHYTGDLTASAISRPLLLHAVVVQSTSATGRILQIHTAEAEAAPGVCAVLTHLNSPRLKRVKTLSSTELDSYLPLQDDVLHYNGQPIAVVIAETLLEAQHAASIVTATYEPAGGLFSFMDALPEASQAGKVGGNESPVVSRGHPEPAFSNAEIQLDESYLTAAAHHNAIEPGATVAAWDAGGCLTVWNATQFSYGDAAALGEAFGFGVWDKKPRLVAQIALGIELDAKVRVIAPLVGGGFGGKGANANLILAAMAAKIANAPVKLALTREQVFSMMPYRSAVLQRVRIGADSEGRISALLHDATVQNSTTGSFIEPAGELTPHVYACPNVKTTHNVVRLDVNAPGWMRAPGVTPGLFAIECALDELAGEIGLDPVELRLRNYADVDPQTGHRWSSKSLKECYRLAGDRIGWWSQRTQTPRSNRENTLLIGFGMATAAYRTMQFPAVARIILRASGDAVVQSSAQEIGQGALTTLTQIAAEELALPLEPVRFEFGDTNLPFASMTAASSTTLSVGSAIAAAARKIRRKLISFAIQDERSRLHGCRSRDIAARDGRLYLKTDPNRTEMYSELLRRRNLSELEEKGAAGRMFGKSRYGRAAFGAQFAEISVDPDIGEVRVRRLVGAFACGHIINPMLARSQLIGGMIWGIGQALFEQSVIDPRAGRWINANLAEAFVPANSDVRDVEVLLVDEDDRRGSALGAKGLGEIGIAGVAAAIANAFHHATGKRIRELPLKPDRVLAALSQSV